MADGHGRTMLQAHGIVLRIIGPDRQWPAMVRIDDQDFMREFAESWPECWYCGGSVNVESHHLCAGRKGRSDEPCAVVRACGDFGLKKCHRRIESGEISFEDVLRVQWEFNRRATDWVQLCLLAKQLLLNVD